MRRERDDILPLRSEFGGTRPAQIVPGDLPPLRQPAPQTAAGRPQRGMLPPKPLVTTTISPAAQPAGLRSSPLPAQGSVPLTPGTSRQPMGQMEGETTFGRKKYFRPDGSLIPDQRSQNQRNARSRVNRQSAAPPPNVPPQPNGAPRQAARQPEPYQLAPSQDEPILELPSAPPALREPHAPYGVKAPRANRATPRPGMPLPRTDRNQPAREEARMSVILPIQETPLAEGVCPICRGAGYLRLDVPFGHPSFGKPVPCECKERELEQKRREQLWRLSSLDAFQEMTFESFNPKVPGTREAWEVARRYAENPEGWMLFSGTCGSGKTHLAAAIANVQFQQGTLVLFAVVPKLLDHLRAAFAPTSATTYDALFEKVCEAGLLVLDDLGAEHTTPWAQEKLFQIINHRYMYQLPTVITTNLDLINDLDDRVRSRLTDISQVRHVRLAAADYRPKNAPQRQPRRG